MYQLLFLMDVFLHRHEMSSRYTLTIYSPMLIHLGVVSTVLIIFPLSIKGQKGCISPTLVGYPQKFMWFHKKKPPLFVHLQRLPRIFPQIALAVRLLTSSIGVRVRRFFWGRVPCEGSSDVQLVVCMGECTQIFWIRFGGQQVSSMQWCTSFISCLLLLCFIK